MYTAEEQEQITLIRDEKGVSQELAEQLFEQYRQADEDALIIKNGFIHLSDRVTSSDKLPKGGVILGDEDIPTAYKPFGPVITNLTTAGLENIPTEAEMFRNACNFAGIKITDVRIDEIIQQLKEEADGTYEPTKTKGFIAADSSSYPVDASAAETKEATEPAKEKAAEVEEVKETAEPVKADTKKKGAK